MPKSKCILLDNVIGVGGFAGVGKSTLISNFFRRGYPVSYEFNESSVNAILQLFYQKYMNEETDAFMMQIAFLNHTIERYSTIIKQAQPKKPVFIDRTIIEDIFFARGQIDDDKLLDLYEDIWEKSIEDLSQNVGLPSVYFHIHLPFEKAINRIFERDPKEKEEKTRNIEKFKKIYKEYETNLKRSIESFGIEYILIDATKCTREELFDICWETLLKRKIVTNIIE